MKISVLAKIIGENSAVGLIGLLFGDEGKIELAEQLDSERLLSAVNSEANMDMRLKKASVLIATLRTSRSKILSTAQSLAKKSPESPALKNYAVQIADLDRNIADLQGTLDKMMAGSKDAETIVNSIQAQVTNNLVSDQLTLTKKALTQILNEQVMFTQDMITALPSSNLGSKLRKSVEQEVDDDNLQAESKLAVLQRLMAQQAEGSSTGELDEAGDAAMAEILGK